MATVQIRTEVSLAELLQGVQQLDLVTLEQFADEVMKLRAKRRALTLSKDEVKLLQQINQGLPTTMQARFEELKSKREMEALTSSEYDELLAIVEEIEQRDVERLHLLTELAQLRGVAVRDLMHQLGLIAEDSV